MIKLRMAVSLLFSTALYAAPATEYSGTAKSYSSDEVIAILGKMKTYPVTRPYSSGIDFQAGVKSKLKCGNIRFDTSYEQILEQVKKLPDQLGKAGAALVNAAPILTLCYASPTICAEVKNLNFRIDQELKLLTDSCKAIDDYVTNQAEQGEVEGRKKALQECIQARSLGGLSVGAAVQKCEGENLNGKYIDIAQSWVKENFTDAPQDFLKSALTASGQSVNSAIGQENYKFLSSVMGETKISSGGKSIPVFPAGSQTTAAVSNNIFAKAQEVTCNRTSLLQAIDNSYVINAPTDEEKFPIRKLIDTTHEKIDKADHNNLFDLDPPDLQHACRSLARSLAKESLLVAARDGEALAVKALQNPFISSDLRQNYEQRIKAVFPAMREAAQAEQAKPVDDIRRIIAAMAKNQRAQRRLGAKALSRGEMSMDTMTVDSYEECDSEITCAE